MRYLAIAVGTALTILAGCAVVFLLVPSTSPKAGVRTRGVDGLRISPPTARFGDRVFADGEPVRASFHLVNTVDRPITIQSVNTSCSCMATVAEDGKILPLALGPKESLDLVLATTALAAKGLEQAFSAIVVAEPEAAPPVEHPIGVTFQVADALLAEPAEVRVYEAPLDKPARTSIVLFTRKDPRLIAAPTVQVQGSDRIHAEVKLSPIQNDPEMRKRPRYTIEVAVDPGDSDVSGQVEVKTPGEPTITIPVACFFRRDVRFQPPTIEVVAGPGERFETEVYQEYRDDLWKSPRVFAKPDGCEVKIEPFDAHTNRLHVSVAAKGTAALKRVILLQSSDGKSLVTLPIHDLE